jgi:O-antigen/teichoic acid export membrane protein
MATLQTALRLKTLSKWFSDENLTKKAYLNALAAVLDYGARLLVGFIINPLLVAGLGDYFYGVWQILGRMTGYISIAGGRPTQALKWTVVTQQTSRDYEKKRRDVGSAVIVWLLFLPIMAVLGAILVWFAPSLLHTPPEFLGVVRLAVSLLVLNVLLDDLADVPQSVVRGENLGYKRIGLSSLLMLLGGGLTAIAIFLGTGLIGVAAVTLANTLLTGAFFLKVAHLYVPWFGIVRPSWNDIRRFFSLSWWYIFWRLVQQAMMASDTVVLGLLKSVELVTTYSLTMFVPQALTNLTVVIVGGITPGLGGVISAGNLPKAARIRGMIMAVTWLVATIVGATALLWSQAFISLWVGAKYYPGTIPTFLIICMVAQFVLIRNDANLINLTLDLRSKVLIGALSVAVSLGLAATLIRFFNLGITGLCVGFMTGRLIISLAFPWFVGRFLGISFYSQLKGAVRPVLVMILLFGLVLGIRNSLTVSTTASTWMGLIFSAGITVVMVSLVALYAGLSGEQRHGLWQRLQMAIPSGMIR